MKFNLSEIKELAGVPSASGIVKVGEVFYAIGDDSPFLFKLNSHFSILKKIQLVPSEKLENEIFEKKDKPDFEAITLWEKPEEKLLLIFGSGSKSPQRDVLFVVNLAEETAPMSYSLTAIYEQIRKSANIAAEDFNIEGALAAEDKLLLFNRGNNMIFCFNIEEFLKAIKTETEFPKVEIYNITLPVLGGIQGGFSGVTYLAHNQQILFTATLENTSNWIDDGEVLGSYLGFLKLKNLHNHDEPKLIPVTRNNHLLKIKVEGIAVSNSEEGAVEIVLVTDSDGAASEVLTGKLLN